MPDFSKRLEQQKQSTDDSPQPSPAGVSHPEEGGGGGKVLEDLLLQAEIFLQYGMTSRAVERLERIARQFPGEEEHNEKLRALYAEAEFKPLSVSAAPPVTAPAAPAQPAPDDAIADITRISEITRNIYRQATVKTVLSTAANEIGKTWRISRCVAGLCTPGKAPSAAVEYCSPGMTQSDVKSIVKLITTLVAATREGEPLPVEDIASSPKLSALSGVAKSLNLVSLLAIPLVDADQMVGVIVLEQCDRMRRWRAAEVQVLKTLADQIVLTVSHVRLRTLMKTLSVADEQSGLLNRKSYIDCLLAETTRAQKQNAPLSVILMQFGRSIQARDEAVQRYFNDAVQTLAGHFRQNDVAVRYEATTLALVMPDTKGKDTFFVIDKIRKVLSGLKAAQGEPPALNAGIAEAVLQGKIDPVDSVTELINRADLALEAACKEGGATSKLLMPPIEFLAL